MYYSHPHHNINMTTITVTPNTNILYRRAILHAIGELQDYNHRSNVDSIRRHVQSTLEVDRKKNHRPQVPWNETIFVKTLKSLIQDGNIEPCTSLNCGLSPQFKRKVTTKAQQLTNLPQLPSLCGMTYPYFTHEQEGIHNVVDVKDLPVKKPEHYKLKIVPKKIYDLQQ
jgi:hypothetical protein